MQLDVPYPQSKRVVQVIIEASGNKPVELVADKLSDCESRRSSLRRCRRPKPCCSICEIWSVRAFGLMLSNYREKAISA